MSRPQILVVDDEPQIHRFLKAALEAAGYEARRADTGREALREIGRKAPDVVVLDLGLPDMDGKQVLLRARAFYAGPIIVLSARDREVEKIDALDKGANDYVEKPFGVGELLARLRVVLRERPNSAGTPKTVRAGDVEIDLEQRRVIRAGTSLRLSSKAFDLLSALANSGGRVVGQKALLSAVWGPAHGEDAQYLRVAVGQLRRKLEPDPASPRLIITEPGVGYRLVTDGESSNPSK